MAEHISRERRIFTTAHELGHLVLHGSDYSDDALDANANTLPATC